jgi:hypothetical protein
LPCFVVQASSSVKLGAELLQFHPLLINVTFILDASAVSSSSVVRSLLGVYHSLT